MKRLVAYAALLVFATKAGLAATSNTLPVSVTILNGAESFISVSPNTATLDASVHPGSYIRFNSGIFTCAFFAAYQPWNIRVYHTNGDATGSGPFKSATDNRWLTARVWQPNYGVRTNFNYYGKPTNFYDLGYLPDPMLVWTTGVSRLVRDISQTIMDLASSEDGDVSPVRFNFVVMDTNRVAGTYSGNVTFELITP